LKQHTSLQLRVNKVSRLKQHTSLQLRVVNFKYNLVLEQTNKLTQYSYTSIYGTYMSYQR